MESTSQRELESAATMQEETFQAYVEQLGAQADALSLKGGLAEEGHGAASQEGEAPGTSRDGEEGSDACQGTNIVASCSVDETPMEGVRPSTCEVGPSTSQGMESQVDNEEDGNRVRRHRRKRTPQQQHLNKLAQQRYRERRKHRMTQMEMAVAGLQARCASVDALQRENALLRGVNSRLRGILLEQQGLIASLHGAPNPSVSAERQLLMRGEPGSTSQQRPEESSHLSSHAQVFGQVLQSAHVQPQSQSVSTAALAHCLDIPFATQGMASSSGQGVQGAPHSPFHSPPETNGRSQPVLFPPPSPFRAAATAPFGGEQHVPGSGLSMPSSPMLNPLSPGRLGMTQCPPETSQEHIPQSHCSPVFSSHSVAAQDLPVKASSSHRRFLDTYFPTAERRSQSMASEELIPQSLLGIIEQHSLIGVPGELPSQPAQLLPNVSSEQSCMLEGSPASVQTGLLKVTVGHCTSFQPTARDASLHVNTSGVSHELETQVQALQQILEGNAIFMGGLPASDEVLHLLGKLLSSTAAIAARIVRSRVPRAGDFVSNCQEALRMELSLEEREKWDKCLVILNLTKTQETAILDLRGEHTANIHRLFEERSRLNEQARGILQASRLQPSNRANDMAPVWAQVKTNINQEHKSTVDAMHMLLFSILEPVQASLLTVEAYPDVVDVMKLANALAARCGESR